MLAKLSFSRKVPVWVRGFLVASFFIEVASLVLIYQPVRIQGNSMTPLLSDHEAIIINTLVYHFEPICRGDVVINGRWIPEPYVLSQYADLSDFGPMQVPSDTYFVLGDHRNSSNDSRVFGTVARRLIEWPSSLRVLAQGPFWLAINEKDNRSEDRLLRESSFWLSR